jgi:hypothetical protein
MKKTLMVLGVVLFIVFLIRWFSPMVVVDSATNKPVSGVGVSFAVSNWANGCGNERTSVTNKLGIASFGGIVFPCQITISRDGYHTNGSNDPRELNGFLGFKKIKIHRIENPQEPIVFDRVFTESRPGMDVLSYLRDLNPDTEPENLLGDQELDFSFTTISNSELEKNVYGRAILRMHFNGEGGVQAISDQAGTGNDAGKLYYDLENLLLAPQDGYKQDLDIEAGKSYVARLRDGAHYMKFHVFGSKRDGENYACMTAYVQPNESTNLEFNNIYKNWFCSSDKNSSNYDLKQDYLTIKEKVEGEHQVRFITKLYPTMEVSNVYVDEPENFEYYFYLIKTKTPRVNAIPSDSLLGKRVNITLPDFDEFSRIYSGHSMSVPVNMFLDGKYIDPSTIY